MKTEVKISGSTTEQSKLTWKFSHIEHLGKGPPLEKNRCNKPRYYAQC